MTLHYDTSSEFITLSPDEADEGPENQRTRLIPPRIFARRNTMMLAPAFSVPFISAETCLSYSNQHLDLDLFSDMLLELTYSRTLAMVQRTGVPGINFRTDVTSNRSQVPKGRFPKGWFWRMYPCTDILFLLFGSLTFWQFCAVSLPKGGRHRPSVLPELRFAVH